MGNMNDAIYSRDFDGKTVVGFMSERNFARFDWLIDSYEIQSVIELGAFVGMSTIYFAQRVQSVITIDNFDIESQKGYPRYLQPIHEEAAANQYRVFLENTLRYPNIRGIVGDFLESASLPIEADMVYLDGIQPYPEMLQIVKAWMPKARKIIGGDDAGHATVQRVAQEVGATNTRERTWWMETCT
jgi:predicted O-methyltransferase YrrM